MANPYDPQTPARPQYFGGRKKVLKQIQERIDAAKFHHASGAVLIHGHRGVGKTSLLKKVIYNVNADQMKGAKVLYFYRRLGRTTNDEEMYRMLNEELSSAFEVRKNWFQKMKSAGRHLEMVNLSWLRVKIPADSQESPYLLWKSNLRNLVGIEDYVLVAIDDADFLSVEAIGELKTIVEDAGPVPVLLVVSGGTMFEQRLVDAYSPVARIFSGASFNIGKLDPEETREVLEKPLQGEQTAWDTKAINEIHKLTGGYPYLIQCLASASYRKDERITEKDVRSRVHDAIEIGKSWLNHEIPNASDQDIISFIKITRLDKGILQSADMLKAGIQAVYVGRLVRQGILRKISRGRYELQKSPIIAEFEKLKRSLQI